MTITTTRRPMIMRRTSSPIGFACCEPPSTSSGAPLIRKIARLAVLEIGLGQQPQPLRPDGRPALQQRAGYPVHAIHDAPFRIEHYRVAKIDFLNQPAVLHDAPDRR
jgi:hypothetical protein